MLFPEWRLKFGYWLVKHKLIFKRLFYVAFIVFDAVIISLSFTRLINYYSVGEVNFERMQYQLGAYNIDYAAYWAKHRPKSLNILELAAPAASAKKRNFLATVENPNKEWMAKKVIYHFVYAGQKKTPSYSTFIYPQQKQYLTAFNVSAAGYQPKLVIEKVLWKHLEKKEQKIFQKKYAQFFQFKISQKKFLTARDLKLEKEAPLSAVRFQVTNKSPYNFYQVGFFILTYNGPTITSVNYLTITNFLQGQTRQAEVRWPVAVPYPTKIIIKPNLNIFQKNFYFFRNRLLNGQDKS